MMTRVRAASLLALGLGASLWACNGTTNNPDAADAQSDVPVTDTSSDAPPTDAPTDTPVVDGSVIGMCGTTPVQNLNVLGTRTGNVLDYTSSVASTTPDPQAPIQPTPTLQGNGTTPGACAFHVGREQIFAYTAQTASVLRISTTNTGTDPGFDTVLYVRDATNTARACARAAATDATFLGCNDDDPNFSGDQRRISSTSTLIKQVTAGQTVYIAFGGYEPIPSGSGADTTREQGAYELTVTELTPVALGGACDVSRVQNPCVDDATCVSTAYPSDTGTCVANGSVAGALCTATSTCMNGMTCTSGFCVATVSAPAVCDPYHTCDAASSCVQLERGGAVGVCQTLGSVIGAQCDATNSCATGLSCQTGTTASLCLPSATTTCSTFDTVCTTGDDCVGTGPSGTAGLCTPTATTAGTHCTSTCNTGLACQTSAATPFCATQPTAGQACNQFDVCANGGNCFLSDLTNTYGGTCFDPGTLGGPCGSAVSAACPSGTTCSGVDPTTGTGRCLNAAADGAVCTLTDACPTGDVCVQDNTSGTYSGHCHAAGSVAGAQCVPHGTTMTCATGLTCSSWIPEEGVCQTAGTAGGSCDVVNASVRCPGTQACRSTSIHSAGTCAATTAETEPNDQPWTASTPPASLTTPVAIAGGLTIGDVDCFPVTLHAGQHLYAAATSPSGVCGALNLLLNVYSYDTTLHAPRLLGSDNTSGTDRCPRVEGSDTQFNWAQNTGATDVTWYVCLNNNAPAGGAVRSYVLSVNAN